MHVSIAPLVIQYFRLSHTMNYKFICIFDTSDSGSDSYHESLAVTHDMSHCRN